MAFPLGNKSSTHLQESLWLSPTQEEASNAFGANSVSANVAFDGKFSDRKALTNLPFSRAN
jgi:hypothetical protein